MSLINTNNNVLFSVSSDMIAVDKPLDYEIYINSSVIVGSDRFVKMIKQGYRLPVLELQELKNRFKNLYILESQRSQFVKSFVSTNKSASTEKKTSLVREAVFKHLGDVFHDSDHLNSEVICKSLQGCKDSVESMITIIKDVDVMDVQRLITKLGTHDFYTLDHSLNVAMYCMAFYRMIRPQASQSELMIAGLGGLLHDIGKIKISNAIINNTDKLTDSEFTEVKKHPGWGKLLIEDPKHFIPNLTNHLVAQVIYQHHENYDGSGYPNKIKGENIHLLARLTSFADFYDAVTTKRSYHEALDPEEAINLMRNSSGKKLDPKLYQIFSERMCKHQHFQIDQNYHNCVHHQFDPCQPCIVKPWQSQEIAA